jgi:hypothetical protein
MGERVFGLPSPLLLRLSNTQPRQGQETSTSRNGKASRIFAGKTPICIGNRSRVFNLCVSFTKAILANRSPSIDIVNLQE